MNKTEEIKSTINFIETSTLVVGEFINFYLDYARDDEIIRSAIGTIINGYTYTLPIFPELITGKLDGRNIKNEILKSLEDLQIAYHLCEDYPEDFRIAWIDFSKNWTYYLNLLKSILDNKRIFYINLN